MPSDGTDITIGHKHIRMQVFMETGTRTCESNCPSDSEYVLYVFRTIYDKNSLSGLLGVSGLQTSGQTVNILVALTTSIECHGDRDILK